MARLKPMKAHSGDGYYSRMNKECFEVEEKGKVDATIINIQKRTGLCEPQSASLVLPMEAGLIAMCWDQGLFGCCLARQKDVRESSLVVLSRIKTSSMA